MAKKDQPTEEQLREWKNSRYHEDDGTYRGDFGGPAPEEEELDVKKTEESK